MAWGVCDGKAMIATLRHRLIRVLGRVIRRAAKPTVRLPPGQQLLTEILAHLTPPTGVCNVTDEKGTLMARKSLALELYTNADDMIDHRYMTQMREQDSARVPTDSSLPRFTLVVAMIALWAAESR